MRKPLVLLALSFVLVGAAEAQTYPRLELSALAGTRGMHRDDPIVGEYKHQTISGARADLYLRRSTNGSVGVSGQYEIFTLRVRRCIARCVSWESIVPPPSGLLDSVVTAPFYTDVRLMSIGPTVRFHVKPWLSVDAALRAGWLSKSSHWDHGPIDPYDGESTVMVAQELGATARWSAFTAGASYEAGRLLYRSGTTHTQRIAGRIGLQVPLRQ